MEIKWDLNATEQKIVTKIVKRAKKMWPKRQYIDIEMDITACHLNGCPLDLAKLYRADDFNFAHDVAGIANHINRSTGKIERCFLPRCYDSPKKG